MLNRMLRHIRIEQRMNTLIDNQITKSDSQNQKIKSPETSCLLLKIYVITSTGSYISLQINFKLKPDELKKRTNKTKHTHTNKMTNKMQLNYRNLIKMKKIGPRNGTRLQLNYY